MAAKKKTTKKKMVKVQKKSIRLSVEQLAAIIKGLSPKDRDRLDDIMEADFEITDEMYKICLERQEAARKDPSRMIPWKEVKKRLQSRK